MNKIQDREKLFIDLYSSYKEKIYRICYGYIYEKEQVDDLFQEIMINIWNSLDRFRGDSSVGTWVYRVAVNTALLYNKKTKFYARTNLLVNEYNINTPENDTAENREIEERLQLLARCISRLDKKDRLIITLILEDLSYEQVAEITGISAGNVGVRVNRIKKKLLATINIESHE
jgi:RNA polymerase sigma-70 factor, ECF subfamily